jgi:hypothetical protein
MGSSLLSDFLSFNNPINGCYSNANLVSYGLFGHPLTEKLHNMGSLFPCSGFKALIFPFLLCESYPFSLSLEHHLTLKGCDCSKHGEHEFTSRSGSVQVDVENLEAHSLVLKLVDDLKKVFGASGNPIELRNEKFS